MKNILVYYDEGVSLRSCQNLCRLFFEILPKEHYRIAKITSQELTSKPWQENTALLAFPGGRDIPYHNMLSGIGTSSIKNFVEQGGAYLGICAGAYFGSKSFIFEKGMPIEVIAERDLGFFPGVARGSALGIGKFCYLTEKGAESCRVLWAEDGKDPITFYSYFNGGCYFEHPERYPEITVLAHYKDISKAAIVYNQIGKGRALLSGVHFEYSPQNLNKDPRTQALSELVFKTDAERLCVVKRVLELLQL